MASIPSLWRDRGHHRPAPPVVAHLRGAAPAERRRDGPAKGAVQW